MVTQIKDYIVYLWEYDRTPVVFFIIALLLCSVMLTLAVLAGNECRANGGHMEVTGVTYVWQPIGNSGAVVPMQIRECVGAKK